MNDSTECVKVIQRAILEAVDLVGEVSTELTIKWSLIWMGTAALAIGATILIPKIYKK